MIAYRCRVSAGRRRFPVGRIVGRTLDGMITDRVTGLAAEAAFFALLSLPSLLLAVVGTIGYFHGLIGPDNVNTLQNDIAKAANKVLNHSTVQNTVMPIVRDALNGGRASAVSIGFLVSIWSGSRAMSTYMDAITIAYNLEGHRSWLTKRVLAYFMYVPHRAKVEQRVEQTFERRGQGIFRYTCGGAVG